MFVLLLLGAARAESDFGFGWDTDEEEVMEWEDVPISECIIVGSGPAGSTAALYLGRAGYSPLVLHGNTPGGQLTTTTEIENFPGFKGTGPELVKAIQDQAMNAGAKYVFDHIASVDLKQEPKQITSTSGKRYRCKTLIIATGADAKYLGLPNEQRLRNKGVSGCAVCDGALYKDKDVVVVGGGDAAIEEALYLSKICSSVKLIHRRALRASLPMRKKLEKSTVEEVEDSAVVDVLGTDYVTGVSVSNLKTGNVTQIPCDAIFMAIGRVPATKPFADYIKVNEQGFFVTNGTPETEVPGVYVAGDCADTVYRQAITSAGEGAKAALLAEKYLNRY